jgi:hypothetical protein
LELKEDRKMPRENYAIVGHGIRRSGEDTWIVPTGVKIHFLSFDDKSVTLGTALKAIEEIEKNPEKTPYQVVKTVTGNGTAPSKDYELGPLSEDEWDLVNDLVEDGDGFVELAYAPEPGPTLFSDYVISLVANRDMHVYLFACRNE